MTDCPHCGKENLEGTDECEACGSPLVELSKPRASSRLEKSLFKDRIKALPPREPLLVEEAAPVSMAIKLLYDHKVGCALVVDDDRQLVGIFSERDALMRLGPDAAEYKDRPVSDFMTPDPETLGKKDKIAFALHRMDLGGYRHIPILDGDRITGVISVRDILRYVAENLAS